MLSRFWKSILAAVRLSAKLAFLGAFLGSSAAAQSVDIDAEYDRLAGLVGDGQFEAAKRQGARLLELAARQHLPAWGVAQILSVMGHAYQGTNDLDAARKLYERALQTWQENNTLSGVQSVRTLVSLAQIYIATKDHQRAVRMAESGLTLARRDLEPGHFLLGTAHCMLGEAEAELDLYPAAEANLRACIDIIKARSGLYHRNIARATMKLASVYMAWDQPRYAETYLKRAIAINNGTPEPNSRLSGDAYHDLAVVLLEAKRAEEGEQALRNAVLLREKIEGPQSPYTAVSQFMLAQVLQERRALEEAELLYRKTIVSFDKADFMDSVVAQAAINNWVETLKSMGRPPQGDRLYQRLEANGRIKPEILENAPSDLDEAGVKAVRGFSAK